MITKNNVRIKPRHRKYIGEINAYRTNSIDAYITINSNCQVPNANKFTNFLECLGVKNSATSHYI